MNIELKYERLLERRDVLRRTIKDDKSEIKVLKKEIKKFDLLFQMFSSVLISMRKVVIKELRTIITPVVRHVFVDEDFSFDILYKKSGKRHYYTPVIRDGKKIRIPKYESGGGIIPILDFSLRVAFLEFGSKSLEKVLFLDEPFGWLGSLSYRTTDIISRLSKRLGIQFFINTHDMSLTDLADKKWKVIKYNKRSQVEEV